MSAAAVRPRVDYPRPRKGHWYRCHLCGLAYQVLGPDTVHELRGPDYWRIRWADGEVYSVHAYAMRRDVMIMGPLS